MVNPAVDHTIDSPEEQQRKVRLFVGDLIVAAMGNLDLGKWIGEAVYEKIALDVAGFIPTEDSRVQAKVKSLCGEIEGFGGGIYLRRTQSLLLVTTATREEVDYIRSTPDAQPDRSAALDIAVALQAQGLPCPAVSIAYIPVTSNRKSDLHTETYWLDGADPEAVGTAATFASNLVLATVTRSSDRDVQRLPGPSDLANPCDLCVARRIAASCGIEFPQTPSNFSLKAWVGTAAHQKLERRIPEIYGRSRQEITVVIAEIPGLGIIKGHIDMDLPEWSAMTDFKTSDLKKLALIQATTVPRSHFGQTMLYMYGLHKNGTPRSYATLAYIPRDSYKKSEIWVASCAYREDVAVGLLNRTRDLFDRLRVGDVGNIDSDRDCFVCHVQPLLRG